MTIEQAEEKIKKAGGDVKVFWVWMMGSTCSLYPDGTSNIYEWDVERFIRYKCNPKNEPIEEWD